MWEQTVGCVCALCFLRQKTSFYQSDALFFMRGGDILCHMMSDYRLSQQQLGQKKGHKYRLDALGQVGCGAPYFIGYPIK